MIRRGVSTLGIRRRMTFWGGASSSLFIMLFGVSDTPAKATLWYCALLAGTCLHGSGWSANCPSPRPATAACSRLRC